MKEQTRQALERANYVRITRTAYRRRLRKREASLSEMLRGPIPDWLETEPIGRLLRSLRGVGSVREKSILRQASMRTAEGDQPFPSMIKPNAKVGTVTPRQRAFIADVLNETYYKVDG